MANSRLEDQDNTSQATFWISLLVIVILIGAVLFLKVAHVPYQETETYQEQVPYEVERETIIQEPYSVQVHYTENITTPVKQPVNTRSLGGEVQPQPYIYKDKKCRLANYDYDVQYFDGSTSDLAYLSDISYNRGGSTDPVRTYLASFDRFGTTSIGFNERTNILTVVALVCNNERKSLNGQFAICQYWKGKKGSCPDTTNPRIAAHACQVVYLPWYTRDPVGKTLRLEPVTISQKFVCEPTGRSTSSDLPESLFVQESRVRSSGQISGQADYETVYLKLDTLFFTPYYQNLFVTYLKQEYRPIVTESGTLAMPMHFKTSSPIANNAAVTSATRNYMRTYTVTKYKNETRYKDVVKKENIIEYKTVDKTREVTKFRTLWDELMLKLRAYATSPTS